MDIKLKAKLSAYSKAKLPTKLSDLEQDIDYVKEAPIDTKFYIRKDGNWEEISFIDLITLAERSGLSKEVINDKKIQLKINYWEGEKEVFLTLDELTDDFIYYVYNKREIELFVNGGNAFSHSEIITQNMELDNDILGIRLYGGNAYTTNWDLYLVGSDSKGE